MARADDRQQVLTGWRRGALATSLLVALGAGAAFAQPVVQSPTRSANDNQDRPGAVVQQVPSNDTMNLNAALVRLGRNPRDGDALIDAGHAALTIGDVDAAIGFFRRAEQVTPGNARVKAGLARALVRSGNPFDAIPLFDDAERAAPLDSATSLDRGLAYDLVADNAAAQRYYRQALSAGPNDEATRRLAISLAIAGDKRTTATILSPLLLRQDKAAWRARAFSLAILGQTEEAITVANGTLPAGLAAGIAPYLRYMPRLTPSQQAAAANFGQFPRASEIGRDDPRVVLFATNTARRPTLASADAALIPKGEPLGRNARGRQPDRNAERNSDRSRERDNRSRANSNTRQSPPEVALADPVPPPFPARPAAAPQSVSSQSVLSQTASRQSAPQPPRTAAPAMATPSRTPVTVAASSPPAAAPAPPTPASPTTARTLIASNAAPPAQVPTVPKPAPPTPAPPPAPVAARPSAVTTPPVPPTPRRQSLAEAFSDLGRPTADATPASGAVDIRRIRPAREPAPGAAKEAPAPAAPSHPSRIWVQIATGRDKGALGFDFRRMSRQAESAFKARRAFVSSWGQTNRLLTGPFETEAAANAFITQLRRANVDGAFVWTSPAGQVVDALAAR